MRRLLILIIFVMSAGVVSASLHTPALAAESSVQASITTPIHTEASTSESLPKEVALTFDDGPYGTSTEKILQILEENKVPATFFVIGQNVRKYPALVKRMLLDGDAIGNHTYYHSHLELLSTPLFLQQVAMTDAVIASTTGVHTKLFRAPYGVITPSEEMALTKRGYHTYSWNVDPRDWDDASSTTRTIFDTLVKQKQKQMIVLLHDGRDIHIDYSRDNTIGALPLIIDELREKGYRFVRADRMATTSVTKILIS
jgi:peptidoglycan/xylan/chitin deacetylase (PgdA/CDA1 family)